MKKILLIGLVYGGITSQGVAVAADVSATPPSWAGLYVGGNIGYGFDSGAIDVTGRATDPLLAPFMADFTAAGNYPASVSPSARGVIGGAQIGYNWQMSERWLLGAEADIQAAGIRGSKTEIRAPFGFDTTSTIAEKKVGWFGTVRGRAGYLVTPQWLLYATAGLAFGDTTLKFNYFDVTSGCITDATICAARTSSTTRVGWTVGAGVEALLAPNWSVKAEYLYVDLGKRSADVPAATAPIAFKASSTFHEQIVRVGLNYHFN